MVLHCPTGGGKSVLGAVISTTIDNLHQTKDNASIIAMGTNALSKQYAESFSELGDHKVFQIKGANNYPCKFMESQPGASGTSAEDCCKKGLPEFEVQRYCLGCEYDYSKKMINKTANLITNYAYFLTANLTADFLAKRKLHVFDEAHTLNDIFCSFAEVNITVDLLDRYIKELSDVNGKCDNEAASLVMLKKYLQTGSINEDNYIPMLDMLCDVYLSAYKTLQGQASMLEKEDVVKSSRYTKMASKYARLRGKIIDIIHPEVDLPHVFDSSIPNTITVKPIFIGNLMDSLLTDFNLFMSGTITKQFVYETLNLDPDETKFVEVPAVFPPKNKPLFFIGKDALNYNTMKEKSTIQTLKDQVQKISERHSGQKGLILVPSFFLGSQLAYSITGTKVFEHKSGTNLPEIISSFKQYKGGAVLVSPSIFEGLDFKGDDSRWQIIVKSPFPSLGDKRIKYIAENYPNIYREMTLIKLIQGVGRSIRTPEDTASTYFLDKSSKQLFDSSLNVWKDQYYVVGK